MHKTTAKGRDKGTAVGFDSVGKRFELHLQNHKFVFPKNLLIAWSTLQAVSNAFISLFLSTPTQRIQPFALYSVFFRCAQEGKMYICCTSYLSCWLYFYFSHCCKKSPPQTKTYTGRRPKKTTTFYRHWSAPCLQRLCSNSCMSASQWQICCGVSCILTALTAE